MTLIEKAMIVSTIQQTFIELFGIDFLNEGDADLVYNILNDEFGEIETAEEATESIELFADLCSRLISEIKEESINV